MPGLPDYALQPAKEFQDISEYLARHKVYEKFDLLAKELVAAQPSDPVKFLIEYLETSGEDTAYGDAVNDGAGCGSDEVGTIWAAQRVIVLTAGDEDVVGHYWAKVASLLDVDAVDGQQAMRVSDNAEQGMTTLCNTLKKQGVASGWVLSGLEGLPAKVAYTFMEAQFLLSRVIIFMHAKTASKEELGKLNALLDVLPRGLVQRVTVEEGDDDVAVMERVRPLFTRRALASIDALTEKGKKPTAAPRVILVGSSTSGAVGAQGKLLKARYNAPYVDAAASVEKKLFKHTSAARQVIERLSQKDCVANGFVLSNFPTNKAEAEELKGFLGADSGYHVVYLRSNKATQGEQLAIVEVLGVLAQGPKGKRNYVSVDASDVNSAADVNDSIAEGLAPNF